MEWKSKKVKMLEEVLLAQVVTLSICKGGISSNLSLCCKHQEGGWFYAGIVGELDLKGLRGTSES